MKMITTKELKELLDKHRDLALINTLGATRLKEHEFLERSTFRRTTVILFNGWRNKWVAKINR